MTIVDEDEDLMRNDNSNKWWWIDNSPSGSASIRSPWLRSTLSELDRKTKGMMKLIEPEADSFAQRAEMYYKKRPELISMVQDFYKAQRSLVEQFDQLQNENRTRLPRLLLSPTTASSVSVDYYERNGGKRSPTTMSLNSDHHHHEAFDCKSTISSGVMGDRDQDRAYEDDCSKSSQTCDSHHSELYNDNNYIAENSDSDSDSAAESEVDDPDDIKDDDAISANKELAAAQVGHDVKREYDDEVVQKLKEEVEQLKEENRLQREQLTQKDEEKREVIRQLSSAMEILRFENMEARTLNKKQQQQKQKKKKKDVAEEDRCSENRSHYQHRVPFELEKLKDSIFTKLFHGRSPISKSR